MPQCARVIQRGNVESHQTFVVESDKAQSPAMSQDLCVVICSLSFWRYSIYTWIKSITFINCQVLSCPTLVTIIEVVTRPDMHNPFDYYSIHVFTRYDSDYFLRNTGRIRIMKKESSKVRKGDFILCDYHFNWVFDLSHNESEMSFCCVFVNLLSLLLWEIKKTYFNTALSRKDIRLHFIVIIYKKQKNTVHFDSNVRITVIIEV